MERSEGFLDILLEVLNENDRLSFQQMIESIFGSVDFQKSIDDENDEKDTGKDGKVKRRETSLVLLLIQNRPHVYSDLTPSWEWRLRGGEDVDASGPCIIRRKGGNSISGHQPLSWS